MKEKSAYKTPELTAIGEVEKLTLGAVDGTVLDADFPAGTPKPDLTFS